MNNKQIIIDAQRLYNPKTAFGNEKLLKLLKQTKVLNKDGNFEVVGYKIVEVVGVKWECASCGSYNKDEIQGNRFNVIEYKKAQCKNCKAKHLIEISD